MLKIRELSDVIDIAQWTKVDEELYYDPINYSIIVDFADYSDEEIDLLDESKDNLIHILVDPFGKDMFLSFFGTINNPVVRDMFFDKFHGSKKYRRVKDLFPRYHLLDAFYKFKDQYHLKIAKAWCEENKISYVDVDGKEIIFK